MFVALAAGYTIGNTSSYTEVVGHGTGLTPDVIANSDTLKTEGNLFGVHNQGNSKFRVDYAGRTTAAGGFIATNEVGSGVPNLENPVGYLALKGTLPANCGDDRADITMTSENVRDAGYLLAIVNGGDDVLFVTYQGALEWPVSTAVRDFPVCAVGQRPRLMHSHDPIGLWSCDGDDKGWRKVKLEEAP